MKVNIKGIIISVYQSKKNSNQYVNLFDLDAASQYTLVAREVDFAAAPLKVPVVIVAEISPREYRNEGKSSITLYIDQAAITKNSEEGG